MTRTRWLTGVAGAGVAFFALSFVDGWLVQDRELRGEGYRYVQTVVSAWRAAGIPVVALAAVAALVTAAAALAPWRRWRVPAAAPVVTSALVIALVAAAALPVRQDGHASSVDIRPGALLLVGAALALAMLAGSVAVARPRRGVLIGLAAMAAVAGAGFGGRWGLLQAAEGTGRHWEEGSYERGATANLPAARLTIGDGTYRIEDGWSGTWQSSGWTVVLTGDPACPDARGTYHAHGEENDALRFVMVVDPCRDGERAAVLQAGIWERAP